MVLSSSTVVITQLHKVKISELKFMVLGMVADILFHQLSLFFNWYGDLGVL